MRILLTILGLICARGLAGVSLAADDGPPSGRMVSLEVVIAQVAAAGPDRPAIDLDDPAKVLARLGELEDQGQIDALFSARLATLDREQAMVQVGERRPVASGQTFVRGRTEGPVQRSFNLENVGTLISVTPRIDDDGSVLAELQIEQSRLVPLAPRPDSSAAEADLGMSRTATLTAKSTVRIPAGGTVLLGGWHASADGTSGDALILVTAHVSPPTVANPPEAAAVEALKIFALQHVNAGEAGKLVGSVYGADVVHVGVDERTNSLVIKAPSDRLAEIEALLLRLDQEHE